MWSTFRCKDPLDKFQLYSGGFKSYLKNAGGETPDSDLIVNAVQLDQSGLAGSGETQDSGYTSPYRYGGFLPSLSQTSPSDKSASDIRVEKMVVEEDKNTRIRILLIFSTDGVPHAENIVTGLENFSIQVPARFLQYNSGVLHLYFKEFPTVQVDFFRLNELELWNSLLLNPEACILKWLDEMDFVMPILSPQFLQDLHSAELPAGPPAPTGPMINK